MRSVLSALCWVPPLRRTSRDGGPYDVHHGISDDSHCGPQRLEASVLGLRLVIRVGVSIQTCIIPGYT